MKKLEFIPMLILLSITLSGCNLFDSKNNLPIEMVAFNSLTDKEKDMIPVSPKDSIVEKVTVNGDVKSLIDNNYGKDKVYSVTFNHTKSVPFGNLVVFVDLDEKTVLGKGFSSK
ncbi:hypothetical protein [Metabacillus hrfriensis]|uniref:Uncharacterized protein n=1 Tax=Metabacillus hrfriensis TaxID=3048891 RepID=A0ACD4REP7_9BACI|nr:hypothetical protein [Metabacillus sp. CT-WN-B3]WHZ58969.1 hypothetical protein QLQ22_06415 [Metabacillus sp. CT-WN-B3]